MKTESVAGTLDQRELPIKIDKRASIAGGLVQPSREVACVIGAPPAGIDR